MKEPSLSERVRKASRKQLIDVYENSGFIREKKPFHLRVLVETALSWFPINVLTPTVLDKLASVDLAQHYRLRNVSGDKVT